MPSPPLLRDSKCQMIRICGRGWCVTEAHGQTTGKSITGGNGRGDWNYIYFTGRKTSLFVLLDEMVISVYGWRTLKVRKAWAFWRTVQSGCSTAADIRPDKCTNLVTKMCLHSSCTVWRLVEEDELLTGVLTTGEPPYQPQPVCTNQWFSGILWGYFVWRFSSCRHILQYFLNLFKWNQNLINFVATNRTTEKVLLLMCY